MGPAYLQRPTGSSMRGSERAVREAGRTACQTALTCQTEHKGNCSFRVETLICAYWLRGTGICPGVITPCLDSSCLKLKLAHPLLGCLLHLNRQVKAFIMVKLLETHEMQPRWEVWGSHYFSTWTKVDLFSPVKQGSSVGWFGCYYGLWQPWSAFCKAKQRSYKSRTDVKLEESVNIKS